MNLAKLSLALLAVTGAGCTTIQPASPVSMNCLDSNYDRERKLFTLKNVVGNPVNQQCLLRVFPRNEVASASGLSAGRYRISLSNGGGGGAGGTMQKVGATGGGGGGGGAGATETQVTVDLAAGEYKLTIGAGGPGGAACSPDWDMGGGPGWIGSPSNMVRVATGEVLVGTPGADSYVRPTRYRNEKSAGKMDGHGGSGPGQAGGGHGDRPETAYAVEDKAAAGVSNLKSGPDEAGGAAGAQEKHHTVAGGAGGGGGASSLETGGTGGGESATRRNITPVRGGLGSGGGGGEGRLSDCEPGGRGGHGYIALRPV